jgi:predicted component of type VI protein secretion system
LRAEGLERLARLVAHHSGARFELHEAGFAEALNDFAREYSATADALTYCDVTTAPDGRPVSLSERVADVRRRHTDGPLVRSLARSVPHLSVEVRRTERRLRQLVDW